LVTYFFQQTHKKIWVNSHNTGYGEKFILFGLFENDIFVFVYL